MCFLKTLKPLDQIQFEKDPSTDQSSFEQIHTNQGEEISFLNKLLTSNAPVLANRQDQLLHNLMAFIDSNNLLLRNIQQKLQQHEIHLNSSHRHLDELSQEISAPVAHSPLSDTQTDGNDHQLSNSHPVIQKLFGNRRYQYRLQLKESFPDTIYKERNINISVQLVDNNSQKVLNSNILHLCLAACDENGQWVTENKAGENFMKGKTEIEMYHGEGVFLKVYPRDVSRHYSSGKLHFVVYCKPSMLKFSSNSNVVEKLVDCEDVEPLLIPDLTIKAKKS